MSEIKQEAGTVVSGEYVIAPFQECQAGQEMQLSSVRSWKVMDPMIISELPLKETCSFVMSGWDLVGRDVSREASILIGETSVHVPEGYREIRSVLSKNNPSSRIKVVRHFEDKKYEPENNFNFGGLGGSVASVMDIDQDRPVSFGYDAITIKFLKIGDQSFGSTEGISEVAHATLPADGIFELYKLQCNSQKTLSYFEGFIGDVKIIAGVYRKEAVTFEGNLSVKLYQVVSGDVIDSLSFEVISSPTS